VFKRAAYRLLAATLAASLCAAPAMAQATDPLNPTCPPNPNWSDLPTMRFTHEVRGGLRILRAEGAIDASTPGRLEAALAEHRDQIDEIWLRSPGGDARAGTQAGYIIRQAGYPVRIPAGWACFSACNFMFMGGFARFIDPGGLFIVHMFTHTGNRQAIRRQLARGEESAVGLIGEIEQSSAMLAAEDADFLVRMGAVARLLPEVMYQQRAVAGRGADRSTRRCLTQAELREYNVVPPVQIED
jgi:hypothetical protein